MCYWLQGGSAEIELKKGDKIKLSTDTQYSEKGNKDVVFVDYVNITQVVKPGNRVFVDDGLMSLVVDKVGKFPHWDQLRPKLVFRKCVFWIVDPPF